MNLIYSRMIEKILKSYREDQCCVRWFQHRLETAPSGVNTEKIKKEIKCALISKEENRTILDQFYIIGITDEKLYNDIK